MNNFHYHQDPLYSAASSILEGVAEIQTLVKDFAVGDSTNFGKVLEIGADSITFKAKDLPKTKIAFKQRKMGSSEFLLTKLIKLKEETEVSEEGLDEAYKPLRKSEDLVAELQTIIDTPDSKLWDVTSVSLRVSHEDIFDRFPKIYDYVEDMWEAIMTPDGARKTKEIAKKAIKAVHKYYPIKEEAEESEESLQEETSLSTLRQRLNTHAEAASDANRKGDDEKVKYHQTQINKIKERMAAMVRNESLKEDADPKMQEIDKKIEALMKQRTELETEDDDLQKYISSAIERDEARGNDPEENDSISTAKKELSDIQDKHAKVDSEIQKLRAEKKSMNEAINWLGDYLTTSEKSRFGGYRPTILDKKTKRVMYQSAAAYNTPQEAKDHAEDYLKQKSKGIKNPKVPVVGTYKSSTGNQNHNGTVGLNHRPSFSDSDDYGLFGWLGETEEVEEAVDPATKRRKQLDMARVNAGAMSRDDYNKKYKLGKYRPAGSKLSGPGGLYKNLVKKEALDPDADASVWIDDFVKSDDPRFEGKSKEERIKMALGAWYAAQKKESVEPTAETLEEVVALPSVKKVIDVIDEMTPKEYSNFLHALADNAFGIAVMARRTKPKGPSNADAWEDVADGIRDAAKAYDARPVNIYKTNGFAEETQTLEEGVYPLTKKALDATFNLDPDEFEEFLKELAKNLNNEGDDTGYDEWYQVADHIEKAHKIWKTRDSNI